MELPIDKFSRYQKALHMSDLFHLEEEKTCVCGCRTKLTGRKTRWADQSHMKKIYIQYSILKGNIGIIRDELLKRTGGFCEGCGQNIETIEWEADHIVPVHKGGGGCGLDGFQLLCSPCHKIKTKTDVTKKLHQ